PPGDAKEALLVELTDVACQDPPAAVEGFRGGRRVLPVPLEHLRTLGQDLAVACDADGGAGEGRADGPRLPGICTVDRQRGTRLREAVALEDLHPDAVEGVRQPLSERAAAAEREPHPPPEYAP